MKYCRKEDYVFYHTVMTDTKTKTNTKTKTEEWVKKPDYNKSSKLTCSTPNNSPYPSPVPWENRDDIEKTIKTSSKKRWTDSQLKSLKGWFCICRIDWSHHGRCLKSCICTIKFTWNEIRKQTPSLDLLPLPLQLLDHLLHLLWPASSSSLPTSF